MRLRASFLLVSLAFAGWAACGGKVQTQTSSAGGATATSSPSSSTSTSGGSLLCPNLCAIGEACAGANAQVCMGDCQDAEAGPCKAELDVFGACIQNHLAELKTCALIKACSNESGAFRHCQEQHANGGDASTSVGAGGFGPNGCGVPGCNATIAGTCDCQVNCTGEANMSICIGVPGGYFCDCSSAAGYVGSCVGSFASCSLGTSCCNGHF